jgi:hypothetical protein
VKVLCPKCAEIIPAGGLNAEKDYALCANCGELFRLSDLLKNGGEEKAAFSPAGEEMDEGILRNPPPGTWIAEEGFDIYIGARTRSAAAFVLVPFACVWSGFALWGVYGTQILKGEFDLVLSLFGVPFLAASVFLWGMTLMSVAGKIEICLGRKSYIFKGAGSVGSRKFFNREAVRRIYEMPGGEARAVIFLEGDTRLKIGSRFLNDQRRYFLLTALKYFCREKRAGSSF